MRFFYSQKKGKPIDKLSKEIKSKYLSMSLENIIDEEKCLLEKLDKFYKKENYLQMRQYHFTDSYNEQAHYKKIRRNATEYFSSSNSAGHRKFEYLTQAKEPQSDEELIKTIAKELAEKSVPEVPPKYFKWYYGPDYGYHKEDERNLEVQKNYSLFLKNLENKNSKEYKQYFLPQQKEQKSIVTFQRLEERYRKTYHELFQGLLEEGDEIERIIKALPEIKKRIKIREKPAKLRVQIREKSSKLASYENSSRKIGRSVAKKLTKEAIYPLKCPYCQKPTEKTQTHVDHINPISNGGLSIEKNMILVCQDCNLRKSDDSLRVFCRNNALNYDDICDRLEKADKRV